LYLPDPNNPFPVIMNTMVCQTFPARSSAPDFPGLSPASAACSRGGDGGGRQPRPRSQPAEAGPIQLQFPKAWLNKFPIRFVRLPETSRECVIGAGLPDRTGGCRAAPV
jgi:hypothetical protein